MKNVVLSFYSHLKWSVGTMSSNQVELHITIRTTKFLNTHTYSSLFQIPYSLWKQKLHEELKNHLKFHYPKTLLLTFYQTILDTSQYQSTRSQYRCLCICYQIMSMIGMWHFLALTNQTTLQTQIKFTTSRSPSSVFQH